MYVTRLTPATALKESSDALTKLFDLVATQELANCKAKATIKIHSDVLVSEIPVTTMLFLEKVDGDYNWVKIANHF